MPTASSPVSDGREQIARLKERLAAAQARTGVIEPKRTAAAVREVVDGLRDRLEASARERSELAEALEAARATLARTVAELERERRTREVFEAQAEERRRIADDAVAEAEALAAERDQVLGELAQHRRLEGEQTGLLTQVEAALAQRDVEREAAARELAEARDLANLSTAEIADLEARLREEAAGRARAEGQCRELEAEIARLSDAREALEIIETALVHRRGTPGDRR
jgi:chromosome segregation ATPase